jgi:two-component system response regulator AdeR
MNKIPLVLVVEDDAEIADIVMAYLRRDGLEAIHANTGALAINYHAQHAPSLIVLDIRMPGMDGWSVLTEIRKKSNTPIIMFYAAHCLTIFRLNPPPIKRTILKFN